jgi:hypothetical protein
MLVADLNCFNHMSLAATFLEEQSACSALCVDTEAVGNSQELKWLLDPDSEHPLAAPGHYASSRHGQRLGAGKPSDQLVDWADRSLQT